MKRHLTVVEQWSDDYNFIVIVLVKVAFLVIWTSEDPNLVSDVEISTNRTAYLLTTLS